MTSVERTSDGTGDRTPNRECYRCDRDVEPARLFRLVSEPPAALSHDYQTAERLCCPGCAAAMNLSEFAEHLKARARRGEHSTDG
ncbi:hypothetical protein Halru_2480 [Halovivax ruber XH-70]|uniref:Uncharacterized protein n=1 Tax=Halovivax ruber (strain DSM 18193 / JCM 13892 / XH-70) TaxID=797302 RepID=L0IGE5_HALRX|nr:hypothetical protein [Halovivax ruber]AGB17062.1 hypothetical protein Halru_2480 [Halovivax ruber XH-70]